MLSPNERSAFKAQGTSSSPTSFGLRNPLEVMRKSGRVQYAVVQVPVAPSHDKGSHSPPCDRYRPFGFALMDMMARWLPELPLELRAEGVPLVMRTVTCCSFVILILLKASLGSDPFLTRFAL